MWYLCIIIAYSYCHSQPLSFSFVDWCVVHSVEWLCSDFELLEGLQNSRVECGSQVTVVDWARRHVLQHLLVLLDLLLLELINGQTSMVDRDEVNQAAVFLDVYVCLLDLRLQGQDIGFLSWLWLEEGLHGRFTEWQLLQLFLVITALVLERNLLLHYVFTALDCVDHALDVQHLALDPEGTLSEGWFVKSNGILELGCEITRGLIG